MIFQAPVKPVVKCIAGVLVIFQPFWEISLILSSHQSFS